MQAGRQQTWAGQLERLPHGVLAGRQSPEEGGAGPSCRRGRDGAGRRPHGAQGPRVCCSPGGNRQEVPPPRPPRDSRPRSGGGDGGAGSSARARKGPAPPGEALSEPTRIYP